MSEQYWIAACPKCGWIGSSKDCAGGGAIADTGDYDDCTCPKCFKNGEWVVVEDAGERMSELESQLTAEREARQRAEENAAELARLLNEELSGGTHLGEPVIQHEPDAQLCEFYAVSNYPDLVRAMEDHISRLQAKLPPILDTQPRRVREG